MINAIIKELTPENPDLTKMTKSITVYKCYSNNVQNSTIKARDHGKAGKYRMPLWKQRLQNR